MDSAQLESLSLFSTCTRTLDSYSKLRTCVWLVLKALSSYSKIVDSIHCYSGVPHPLLLIPPPSQCCQVASVKCKNSSLTLSYPVFHSLATLLLFPSCRRRCSCSKWARRKWKYGRQSWPQNDLISTCSLGKIGPAAGAPTPRQTERETHSNLPASSNTLGSKDILGKTLNWLRHSSDTWQFSHRTRDYPHGSAGALWAESVLPKLHLVFFGQWWTQMNSQVMKSQQKWYQSREKWKHFNGATIQEVFEVPSLEWHGPNHRNVS